MLQRLFKSLLVGLFISLFYFTGAKHGFAQDTGADARIDSVAAGSLLFFGQPPVTVYPFSFIPTAKFYYINLKGEAIETVRDSTGLYFSRYLRFGIPVGTPFVMNFEEYANRKRQFALQANWDQIIETYEKTASEQAGLLDFKFDIPGGEESAFATIFGKNEVNIEVNGIANLNIGASVQKNENPRIPPDRQTQIDPAFNQNLALNIRGTIGDKLSIRTNWDTEAAFDFQNRVNIVYDGYDNEILQRVELGNVSIETGNTLIRGGSALFGIKGVAQVGALRVTSILSQQKGRRNTQVITGGATELSIELRPADYEYDQNFFLAFYTRQQFEENMSDPQNIGQALQLIEVHVWKLRESSQSTAGQHQAIALAGLGTIRTADSTYASPDSRLDAFPDSLLNKFRDPSLGVSADDFNVPSTQFVEGYFIPLQEGVDYRLNRPLGFISLDQNLGARQALAVSFKYIDKQTGEVVSVGNVSQSGGDRIFLKLIRPQTITTSNPVWDLMMKNIYSLGVNNVTQEGLKIDIKYTEQNIPSSSLPQRSAILLKDLGLDRVDQQGAPNPDNAIDFSTGTLNAVEGVIIFPYLEPFGDRVKQLLAGSGLSQEAIEQIAFDELYEVKKQIARQRSKNSYYLIEGQSKGSVSASYTLGFSPVEGSVRVYANGVRLQTGTDYIVDYSIGNVTILDQKYLRRGQQIRIEYENNQLVQIEQKTFTGVRAEYAVSRNINVGATYFRLKEKPIQDKIRIGNEPINNTVFGLDVGAQFDMPWLTRLIDNIPLIDTRSPSFITLSGEFAQLRPGIARTGAVEKAIDRGSLFPDERRGVSFIADFEGADIEISFTQPSRWHLAAAPAAVPGYAPDDPYFEPNPPQRPNTNLAAKIARADLRSEFSWYSLPRNIIDILGNVERTPETQVVRVTDVFPNRDVLSEENIITTLDVWYNPTDRGAYNYNDQLKNLLQNEPERTWGGFVTTLPPGQQDLTQNNIQFLEFWVQSVLPDGRTPTIQDLQDYEGKIYIDIGLVSEDVVPNYKTNTEDGLARRPEDLQTDNLQGQARSYIPVPPPAPEGQFSNDLREEADVGLDGAPNTGGFDDKNEHTLFGDFVQSIKATYGDSEMFRKVSEDPSNDDYVYYGRDELSDLPLQKRFYRLYGHTDGNTPANTEESRALTNKPNTEGLITPSIVQLTNAYFQYEIEFNPADFNELEPGTPGTFIVDRIEGKRQSDRWYKVQIPLNEWTRKIGPIDDFQNVSYIRLWMSGYEKPFTLRFATFELVGNQWREAENVNQNQNFPADFSISSINIEEDSRRQPIPYRLPEGVIRGINRAGQRQTIANEQSLVLEVENLGPQELNMIKRVYPGGFNMLNYSNVRMYVHGEGFDDRGDLELVVRFGSDLMNNYYEYRQPITPTDPNYNFSDAPLSELSDAERRAEARQIWLYEENSMNILLSAFNQLKQLRAQQGASLDERYVRTDLLAKAPAGASLTIKGNPSLDRVGEIGLGVINPYDPANPQEGGEPSVSAQVWYNELRVSGFDNRNGWASNGQVVLKLADFATVNLNIIRQTDGFGSLTSRLGQRRTSDEFAYNLFSTVYLDSFIPDRYGWNVPVSFSARRSISTPRYLPNQGDITLKDFKGSVEARDDISEEQQQHLINEKIKASQTYLESYSVSLVNVSKTGSETFFGRNFLDNSILNFVYNTSYRRNPQYRLQKDWNYSGSLLYDINFQNTYLFRPFGFLENVPLLHPLAGLQLGYTPASVTASFGIDRNYNEQRRRSITDDTPFGTGNILPLQQFHNFTYNTLFGFTYNLTPAVRTSFQSRSLFDLSRSGIRKTGLPGTPFENRFEVAPTFSVLKDVITDTLSSRRVNYQEVYTASWQPRLDKIEPVSWINYSANYTGGFQWRNSPINSGLGATISNNFTLGQTVDFNINEWLGGMGWYNRLQEAGARRQGTDDGTFANIGREALLALLSVQSVDVSFNISTSSLQTGYSGGAQFFQMFSNRSTSFGFRTGISNEIGLNRLITNRNPNTALQLPSNRNLSDNLTVGARFLPFNNFSIDLIWNTQWDKTFTRNITLNPDQTRTIVRSRRGNVASSVWAFGTGYEGVFKRQLKIAFQDVVNGTNVISDSLGNRDGRTVLGKRTLQDTFREAYLGIGTATVGSRGFTPFPLPGWKITWTGLEEYIPFIGDMMARASLLHAYSGSYRLGYVFNANQSRLPPLSLGSFTVFNRRPAYEPTIINIEKVFAPLIGVNITWKSNLRTTLQFDYTKLTSLALSNATILERYSKGVRLSIGYTLRNFNLPLFPRIENAVDITINAAYIEDTETKYILSSDLDNVFEDPDPVKNPSLYDFSESFSGGQSRVNASLIVGYQFSQTVKANFEYSFRKLIPRSTGVFPRTDHDILFNVIVSIRSGG